LSPQTLRGQFHNSALFSRLPNPGVHCFFNAAFHCLTGLDDFFERAVSNAKGGNLVKALQALVEARAKGGFSEHLTSSVLPILEIVSLYSDENFADCINHQDAAEFLNVMFNILAQELPEVGYIDECFGSTALEFRNCKR
jgi:ubiquitin C-terminal hydrolase